MKAGDKKHDWWPSDGHDHRDVNRDSIYLNTKIKRFLDTERISLIIASKGMGKTLLMRVKKKILVEDSDGALIIPSGTQTEKVEFDEPKIKSTLSQSGYGDLLLWKGLWSAAIVLSILSHVCAGDEDSISDDAVLRTAIDGLEIDDDFKKQFYRAIRKKEHYVPSHFLSIFLHRYTESELQRFLKTSNVFDDLSNTYITSQTIILIDAFDQALREAFPFNVAAWKFGQLGLAKAAHSLFTTNHHIKVIATIRQEAWAAFTDDDKEVIEGKSLILDYSARELNSLFLTALAKYTHHRTMRDFLGLDVIPNTYCMEDEQPFEYIYRHSTGSPRSLMHFGRALDELSLLEIPAKERAESIRDQVDAIAAKTIFDDYLSSQKTPFLNTLIDQSRLRVLLRQIPSNVLTADSLKSINREFCQKLGLIAGTAHPFCELFNIGLLGKVQQNAASGGEFQKFRRPIEFDWSQEEILEENAIYLLHPGLTSAICRARSMNLNRVNIIGTDRPWVKKNGHSGLPQIFVSHSSLDKPALEEILPALADKLNLRFPSDLWFDKWKIKGGDDIHQKVERGVAGSDIVILFASSASLKSGWVDKEWRSKHLEEIKSGEIRVITAVLNGTTPNELPDFLKMKLAIVLSESDLHFSIEELAESVAFHATERLRHLFPTGA